MANASFYLYLFFILIKAVKPLLPYGYDTMDDGSYTVWDFDEINETEEPLHKRYETFSDGPPMFNVPSETECHRHHVDCLRSTASYPVCAHRRNYGFVAFRSECDIYLENCLITSYETAYGKKSKKEPYYYNGVRRNCHYYTSQAYTIADAIQLYFMAGRVQASRRNEPTEKNYQEATTTDKYLKLVNI